MTTSQPKGEIPDFEPRIDGTMKRKFFDMGAGANVSNNQYFLVCLLLSLALVAQSFAFSMVFPLKSVETVLVQKDVSGGRLSSAGTAVGNWNPDFDSITYFLNQWTNSVYEVNPATIDATIKQSADIVIGTAVNQLRSLRSTDNPIATLHDYPGYSRNYEFITCLPLQDDVAEIRFKTISRGLGADKVRYFTGKITYTRIKPKDVQAVVKNPAGLYITFFQFQEEAEQSHDAK